MIARFRRIYKVFGWWDMARMLLLVAIAIMMVVIAFHLDRVDLALIPFVFTAIGYGLRKHIADQAHHINTRLRRWFIVYGVILALMELLSLGNVWKLFVVMVSVGVSFNLQFWAYSDPDVYPDDSTP